MEGIFQPTHFWFLVIILLILASRFIFSANRVRQKTPEREMMNPGTARWVKAAAAVVLGNALYFYLMPSLPPGAQHTPAKLDFGIVVDFWFCLFMYGIIEGGMQLSQWLRKRK